MKAKKARLLDEQMAKMLHDEEVEKVIAREKQEKDDLERAQVLQQQYDDKEKNIDWNVFGEQVQERNLDNIKKGMTYEKVRPIFESEYKKVQTLFKRDKDVKEPRKKRVAEETLLQKSFKKLKAVEVSSSESRQEIPTNDPKEISKEDTRRFIQKDQEHIGRLLELMESQKHIRVLNTGSMDLTEDWVTLWILVKEKFSSAVPNVDKEKALWVELKRLFKPVAKDVLWKFHRYMHYQITWKLHSNCGVHQVSSTTRRHDIFMLTEKDYPLSNGVMTLMLSTKLQVEEHSEMARDLVMKNFMKANQPKSRSLDTSSK
nr:hypothetical protein [Tanacetum cinerariifolium]